PHRNVLTWSLPSLEQLALACQVDCLSAVLSMELAQDVRYMVFDGPLGEHEFLGNLAITCSFREQLEDLDLPRTQFLLRWRVGCFGSGTTFPSKLDEEFVGNLGLDGGFTCIHLANSCYQFIGGYIFEEIPHGTSLDGIKHIIFIVEGGQDN